MSPRIVVIGAGIGGLTSAALLAARGYDITVLEKEDWVGGKARAVEVDGKQIAAGPTVFTMRDVFDAVFHECGTRLEDHLGVRQAEVIARHAWEGSGDEPETLDLFADPVRSEVAIGDFAGAEAAAGFRSFREEARRIYQVLDEPFLRGDKTHTPLPMMWRIGLHRVGDALAMRPFDNFWEALGGHFEDPRLQQLFGRYSTYCGSDPFQSPATLMLIAHTEARGVWLIDGGIHALARALRNVAQGKGARIETGAKVAQILTGERRVCGVRMTNGDVIEADAVICNGDPAALTSGHFGVQASKAVRAMPPWKRSLSAFVWFAHAETSGFDLQHHNVFFSRDYRAEFDDIAAGRPPHRPTVYLCAQDRSADFVQSAIAGRERIQIIVNAPANGDTHEYSNEEREQCAQAMRETLRRCGLTLEDPMPHKLATPNEWEALFPATGGALYGRASHGWAASFLRQGPRTRIPGLYCAGGATHPSAGVPMAALSGRLAAATIERDLASMKTFHPAATAGGMSMRSAQTDSTG